MSSGKIKSKDLAYDSALPPFLQRLRDQNVGRDTDRHEREIARPRRAKQAEEEEDGPTVVDEKGEVLGREQVDEMGKDGRSESSVGGNVTGTLEEGGIAASGALPDETAGTKTQEAAVGVGKKRKAVKVVGEENARGAGEGVDEKTTDETEEKPSKKMKKKAKPIKLAFNDDDEG
ncbi:hypothetical protein B0A50_07116 [Salinomyces thailandicus]|uniref:DUF4604 domain-containing protein n=1 Tax=Salinomyces thailandicus TaxID=706561 RepID=A0A4U0TNG2_9PEZI|nr:hypothetical protein B0A50_07116 [Salinomyces thailandica]